MIADISFKYDNVTDKDFTIQFGPKVADYDAHDMLTQTNFTITVRQKPRVNFNVNPILTLLACALLFRAWYPMLIAHTAFFVSATSATTPMRSTTTMVPTRVRHVAHQPPLPSNANVCCNFRRCLLPVLRYQDCPLLLVALLRFYLIKYTKQLAKNCNINTL
jgi:hypothetical protein